MKLAVFLMKGQLTRLPVCFANSAKTVLRLSSGIAIFAEGTRYLMPNDDQLCRYYTADNLVLPNADINQLSSLVR
jgi:hypothetical protein